MALSNTSILALIENQIPEYIRSENPNFVQFIKAYYEYMEKSGWGAQLYHSERLLDYKNIDATTDSFIEYFKRDFLPYFPPEIALDERKLVKTAREFYQKKGSPESIKFLFRAVFDKEIEIFYPKDNILRASDGKWNQPQALRILLSTANENLDVSLLKKRKAIGSISRASCIIESCNRTIDKFLNREILEIYISNLRKLFKTGEMLQISYTDSNGNVQLFSEKIIGSISKVNVDPKYTGLRYRGTERDSFGTITYPGDPVVFVGGLASGGLEAEAYVGNVTSGGIKSVTVNKGGYGFRTWMNSFIDVVNAPGDSGVGANLIIQSVDNGNTSYYFVNTDTIEYLKNASFSASIYANTITITSGGGSHLNAANIVVTFTSPNVPGGVQATGNVTSLSSGSVTAINMINVGSGYIGATVTLAEPGIAPNATATINLQSQLYTSLPNVANANALTTIGGALSYANVGVAPMKSINVVSGGSNFKTEPSLEFDSRYITNLANTYLSVNDIPSFANTVQHLSDLGYILAVEALSPGLNYSVTKDKIVFDSGVGSGAAATFTVHANGAINTITVTSRGEGYLTMPNVRFANSVNTANAANGTGASLIAYGFADGEDVSISVDDVGRVKDIRLVSRGFDYISTPNVSLRVQDIVINPIESNQFLYESNVIYQGASVEDATYIAYVDTHNRTSNLLRVYNQRGTIDIYSNVIGPSFEFSVNTAVTGNVKTYGNGKARANAEFLNGLIKYAGFWSKTDGFLSWDQYLQDSVKYHNFSYEVAVEQSLYDYKKALMSILHPAGMSVVGLQQIIDDGQYVLDETIDVYLSNTVTGNITVKGNAVTGQSTAFLTDASVGDMLVIQPDTDREQTIIISSIINNTNLYIQRSSSYIANARLSTNATNSYVTVSTPTTELEISDTITFLNNNISNVANVELVSGNLIKTNVTAVSNSSNLVFLVTPKLNNVNYQIISV